MRNLLLGTTAVVAAALIAPVAQAQDPAGMVMPTAMSGANTRELNVRLGGFFEFRAYNINDDNDRNAVLGGNGRRYGRQHVDFQTEQELNVFIDGKLANGLTYGAVFEFQIDGNQGNTNNAINMDEAYAYLSHPVMGTLRFGEEDSAASIMQVRAPTIQGTSVSDFFDEAFIRQSNLVGVNDGSDATKIIYLSPQYFGFDFGLSYAPNGFEGEGQAGTGASGTFQRDRSDIRNEISAALRYRGVFGPLGVSLAGVAMQADTNRRYGGSPLLRSRVNAMSVGTQLVAFGLTVGGEYTWGDYGITGASTGTASGGGGAGSTPGRTPQLRGQDATHQFVVGATYTIPGVRLQVGGFYGRARYDVNGTGKEQEQEGYGFGLAYPLAPGFVTYVSYGHLQDTNVRGADQNLAQPGFQATRNAESYTAGFRLAF